MTCDQLTTEDLVTWLDGEADAALGARVALHVDSCATCRREADLLRETGALLASLPNRSPAPSPSAGFEARVVAATRARATSSADVARAPRGRLRLLRPRVAAAAAAVAAAVIVVGVGAWWLATPRENDVLTARDEEALADDLAVISNLDALQMAESTDLAELADDLDVIDGLPSEEEGG